MLRLWIWSVGFPACGLFSVSVQAASVLVCEYEAVAAKGSATATDRRLGRVEPSGLPHDLR